MMKFVHALNVVAAYIGMEKFGNAQTVTTRRKTKKEKRASHHWISSSGEEPLHVYNLCIHIDINTRFQFEGDAAIPDGDLFDPASHQRFDKFGEVGSLLCDIIL